MEPAPEEPPANPKTKMYIFNIVKYHVLQAGVMALLALLLGLIPQVAGWVSGLWWLLLCGGLLFVGTVFKVVTDSAFLENHETSAYFAYTIGHLSTWCVLCGWFGRCLLVLSCYTFAGLLIQMTFVQASKSPLVVKTSLGLPLTAVLLMWFCAQIAVLSTWSLFWMGALTLCTVLTCIYIAVFTLACFRLTEDRSSRAVFLSLGAEVMLLWRHYFSIFSSLRSHVQQDSEAPMVPYENPSGN